LNKQQALMTPERLLVPFTDNGKKLSSDVSGIDTGTENQDSKKNPGPMGTSFAISANSTCNIACGCLKGSASSPATIAWCRRSFVPLAGSGFPTGNSGISWEELGCGPRKGAG